MEDLEGTEVKVASCVATAMDFNFFFLSLGACPSPQAWAGTTRLTENVTPPKPALVQAPVLPATP
jgi:hypothetical protein